MAVGRISPCSGEVKAVLEEVSKPAAPAGPDLSAKKSLLHELSMKEIEARRDYGVRVDIAAVEQLCLSEAATLAECRKEAEAAEDRIDKKAREAALVKVQEKENQLKEQENKLKEEANKLKKERNDIEAGNPDLVIIGEQNNFSDGRHHSRRQRGPLVIDGQPVPPNQVIIEWTCGAPEHSNCRRPAGNSSAASA